MHHSVPEDCFLNLPAEITPELARTFPEKINLLLQTQLLGRSVTDLDSALRLVLDLVGELLGFDRAAILWAEEDEPLQLRASRGFDGPAPVPLLRELVPMATVASRSRPLLATPVRCDHPVVHQLLVKAEASSLLSVPLHLEGQVQGALQLLRGTGTPFSVEEAHLLRVFTLGVEVMLEDLQHSIQPKSYAFLDRVTGLFNRRYFEQQLERELDRARRHSEPASVLLVEVEGMDRVRSAHGHLAGEAALQEIARALERVCRKSDTLAYYHGDLLAVILPRTGKADMGLMAQRVFGALTGPFLTFLPGTAGVDLTFSLSAATYPEDAFSPTTMVEVCETGLGAARVQHHRRRFHQPAPDAPASDKDELLD
ncbi:MAG TPA: sensor domain-containing diguanylate cyclase, partial [Deferrisomatales bacterium]|nr:sensor domain-containing diguanylate cyclase [Deferrisomatales bacterium]